MKINLSFRGGASKLPAYLRFIKELDAKGGMTEGRISGCSAGGITAAAIACGYNATSYYNALRQMPGESVMRKEVKAEKGNFFQKVFYGVQVFIASRAWLSDRILKYFEKMFDWKDISEGIELFIGFCIQEELAYASGLKSNFSIFDLRAIFGTKEPAKVANNVNIFFGARDGIYIYDKVNRRLKKVSSDIIPLHRLVFATMWNPVFKELEILIHGRIFHAFDGGIANNESNCAQSENYYQISCIDKKDEPAGGLSQHYRSLAPKPEKTIYCPPVMAGKAFFDFRDRQLEKEYSVPETHALP